MWATNMSRISSAGKRNIFSEIFSLSLLNLLNLIFLINLINAYSFLTKFKLRSTERAAIARRFAALAQVRTTCRSGWLK